MKHNAVGEWLAGLSVALLLAAPAGAASLAGAGTHPSAPGADPRVERAQSPPAAIETASIENWAAGSATLVPMMAVDAVAATASTPDSPADATTGAAGKPVDDLSFVEQATASARQEIGAARDALPKLRDPELKRLAEMLVNDHSESAARLSRLAARKGWTLPARQAAPTPAAAGTAGSSFDARWTADMISGHEHAVALYRAQAQNGDDKELRQYASDTLPTLEQHLARLRDLQK